MCIRQVTDSPPRFLPTTTPRPRRTVRLRFLTGGHQDFFLDELGPILRHPYVVAYFVASIAVSFIASFLFDETGPNAPPIAVLLPVLVISTAAGVLAFMAWFHGLALLRPRQDPVSLLISFPLALSIITVQAVTTTLWNVLLQVPSPSLTATLIALLLIYLFDEIFIATVLRTRTARIIEDVRSFRGAQPMRHPAMQQPDPPASIQAGNTSVPAASILHLQAQGNYVQIFTDTGALQVPGPFSALLARLPQGLGCLVHRSEWVATRAVVQSTRQGRATELGLSNGNTVRVASTRGPVVRDWLAQFDVKPSRRRSSSSGGGDTKRQSRPAPAISTTAIGANTPSAPSAPVIPSKS